MKEALWVTNLLKDLGIPVVHPPKIRIDNQSTMKMVTNERFSNRSKHIDVKYKHVQDEIARGTVVLEYCPTEMNIADMLTKPLAGTKLKFLRGLANLVEN